MSNCPHPDCLAAERAVKRVFAIFGVDIDNPQQVADFQENLHFVAKLRKIADRSILAFFTTLAALVASAITARLIWWK